MGRESGLDDVVRTERPPTGTTASRDERRSMKGTARPNALQSTYKVTDANRTLLFQRTKVETLGRSDVHVGHREKRGTRTIIQTGSHLKTHYSLTPTYGYSVYFLLPPPGPDHRSEDLVSRGDGRKTSVGVTPP